MMYSFFASLAIYLLFVVAHRLEQIYILTGRSLDQYLADALAVLERPGAVTESNFVAFATVDFGTWVLLVSCPLGLAIGGYLPWLVRRHVMLRIDEVCDQIIAASRVTA